MPSLRSVANQFHAHANKLAARAEKAGKLSPSRAKAISHCRDAAAKIEAMISPEDEAGDGFILMYVAKKAAVAPTVVEEKK